MEFVMKNLDQSQTPTFRGSIPSLALQPVYSCDLATSHTVTSMAVGLQ